MEWIEANGLGVVAAAKLCSEHISAVNEVQGTSLSLNVCLQAWNWNQWLDAFPLENLLTPSTFPLAS